MLWVFVLDNGKASLKLKNKLKLIPNKIYNWKDIRIDSSYLEPNIQVNTQDCNNFMYFFQYITNSSSAQKKYLVLKTMSNK